MGLPQVNSMNKALITRIKNNDDISHYTFKSYIMIKPAFTIKLGLIIKSAFI